jgi:putative intracellular protease/amidase
VRTVILVFDGITALDAIGPYEVLRSVPGWEVQFAGKARGEVRTDSGALGLSADHALDEVGEPDIVLVPGGVGNRPLMEDEDVLAWLRQVDATTTWTTSVCTGSLVLGAAGLLEGKRATGHWLFLDPLREFGDPQPPFDSGAPHKAPAPIVEIVTAVSEAEGSMLNFD